jgi:hypothetical protein
MVLSLTLHGLEGILFLIYLLILASTATTGIRLLPDTSLKWVKSSYSGGTGGNCAEVAVLPDGGRAIRDSKSPSGPFLYLTRRPEFVQVHASRVCTDGAHTRTMSMHLHCPGSRLYPCRGHAA